MQKTLTDNIEEHAIPLTHENDLDLLVEKIGNAKIVLLGEASHGTSEFYQIRAEISKKLIQEKGFTIIAVEGDWPSCMEVTRYIKGYDQRYESAKHALQSFNRWPTWMWANEEIADFAEWLKDHNSSLPDRQKTGFYGLDVYSLWESMEEVVDYLEEIQSPDLELAKKAFTCFEPFNRNNEKYAVASAIYSEGCVEEVTKLLTQIRRNKEQYEDGEESGLSLRVNALVMANAERYYSSMVLNDEQSWNIRDLHMVEALKEILDFFGSDSKVIIWEHNTHVGDARATNMIDNGTINVGQVIRERNNPDDVYIVGFGTHSGTVIAADEWGVNMEVKDVPPAMPGSWEDMMHRTGPYNKMLFFNDENRPLFSEIIGHRAIGVVYNPAYERYGNYVPSVMAERYDAFIHVDRSNALRPLILQQVRV
ncbi:protein-L-isoaspartate O-methyltransferase [Bacillus canaveralius]|uniref:Protein-L-isoaspartate O-methyltransferase n=1 Tax=Bacillus canaveralius TaxID=1403243 RepID=A0A2N5GHB3_9BACI|nr:MULTISPECIES: erythromycin esterase family protein [Bacillus]PLR80165.1 protein-L-isoaspartate O-methyltransferase [Bacillus canaveralius]PLR83833.1 protein-L-isoaspartate O-methyltransferase [Bacillus sp. V33-4]PLR98692.1 protein-L-isoaspartate O-methyltransferase [Bacillus canaveralius]RSK48194.1 erythromycin esterase family protein [Bacillus canaveralius]